MLKFLSGLVITALVSLSPAARGCDKSESLPGSVSPDRHYEVCLEASHGTRKGVHAMVFRLHHRQTGRTLLEVESSFSTNPHDPDETPGYWENIARSSSVFWNQTSTLVAVDEYPVHSSGHVYLLAIRHHRPVKIDLPEREILTATGRRWGKARLRVQKEAGQSGWLSATQLALTLAVSSLAADPNPPSYGDPDYEAILEVHDRHATIVSVRAGNR